MEYYWQCSKVLYMETSTVILDNQFYINDLSKSLKGLLFMFKIKKKGGDSIDSLSGSHTLNGKAGQVFKDLLKYLHKMHMMHRVV